MAQTGRKGRGDRHKGLFHNWIDKLKMDRGDKLNRKIKEEIKMKVNKSSKLMVKAVLATMIREKVEEEGLVMGQVHNLIVELDHDRILHLLQDHSTRYPVTHCT